MKRVLFVDDEPNVLEGLRVLLRKQRARWEMEFANGGEQALAVLGARHFDVVVTDLRMPRVDGLELLKHLRDQHPRTVRVVLSGEAGKERALAAVPFAHQFLAKPCKLAELEAVLARAWLIGDLVGDQAVRDVIGSIDALPPLPRTYARLLRVIEDENAGVRDLAKVLGSDIGLTTRLLKLANSALFGVGRPIATVAEAIPLLGTETIKSVSLVNELVESYPPDFRHFAEDLHAHSTAVSAFAAELATEPHRRDALAAGMLHDVGRLVLASKGMSEDGHAEVGAYLLGLWGLPPVVIEAVAHHHWALADVQSIAARAVVVAEAYVDRMEEKPTLSALTEMKRLVNANVKEEKAA